MLKKLGNVKESQWMQRHDSKNQSNEHFMD
jgi:hypothetical protein